ncbi:MAG TPA: sugar phosphate isomerase/epimerase family protein [Bryobacteraceae bacterium]|nr:sugar phosphate isomerase/epimerase family protein [Bryobacteraceae bacterium]
MYPAYNAQLTGGRVQWPESAPLAAKVGFPGVDVGLLTAMKNGLESTRKLLDSLNLRPAAVDLPVDFRKDDETFRKGLRLLPDAGSFAAAIGCPRMVTYILSSSDKPKAEQRKILLDRFRACADILARSHVRLGLEFLGPLHIRRAMPYEFIWRMDEMLAFAKECGSNCGLLLDTWHWHHAGATVDDILAAGKERIVHVHFNDAAKQPPEEVRDNQRLLPGEGVINLIGLLKALKKIGYEDALSVEVFGRGLKEMPVEQAARMGRDAAVRPMREAGVA